MLLEESLRSAALFSSCGGCHQVVLRFDQLNSAGWNLIVLGAETAVHVV
jgi:hypothetical protein